MKTKINKQKFRFQGSLFAILSAFIASIVMNLVYDFLLFHYGKTDTLYEAIGFQYHNFIRIGLIFFITSGPALIGGYILAILIQSDVNKKNFSKKRSMVFGGILGFLISSGCSLVISELLDYRYSAESLIILSITALILGLLAGVWTGNRLSGCINNTLND